MFAVGVNGDRANVDVGVCRMAGVRSSQKNSMTYNNGVCWQVRDGRIPSEAVADIDVLILLGAKFDKVLGRPID